ncbi:7510_t:CDS:2, partial [Cetraspora pellucida]
MPDNSLYSLRSSSIRNNGRRFSTTTVTENSNSEYSDSEYNNSEYSDPELLIYELENSNETNFDNEKTELNEEEAKQLIYENSSFYDLRWDNKASGDQLLYYSGGSKRTQQHKNKKLQEAAQGSMSLNNFFKPKQKFEIKYEISDSDTSDLDIANNNSISEQLNTLNNRLKNTKNMNAYDYLHLLAVYKYLNAIFFHEELQSRIELSLEISQVFQRGPWIAHRIRKWSKSWITTGALPDIQSSCLRYIHTISERIIAEKFQQYIQDNILPHLTSSCTLISLKTARTWLHCLGLVYQQHQQSVYYDGHECPDVVQYRSVFLEKMKNFESLMPQFVGENMNITINPEISKEQRIHIFVTYDESFMISKFLTETHGRLTITLTEI